TREMHALSLHDALPILSRWLTSSRAVMAARPHCHSGAGRRSEPGIHNHRRGSMATAMPHVGDGGYGFRAHRFAAPRNDSDKDARSEEHTSELQLPCNLV